MKINGTGLYRAEWQIFVERFVFPPPMALQYYHYTNASNKERIVHGNSIDFCLSKANDFLDKNEGIAILEPYYHACGKLYETGEIDRDFFLAARSITPRKLRKYRGQQWALCLTPHGCSNFMKERYAAKDGWIISFQMLALDELCSCFPKEYGNVDLVQMQYSFKRMQRRIESDLKTIYSGYREDVAAKIPKTKKKLQRILLCVVFNYSIRYKGTEYKGEDEVRLLCKLKEDFSHWTNDDGQIKLLLEGYGKKQELHLILGERHFIQATQEMKRINDKRLNKCVLDQKTIQEVLNEK